MDTIGTAIGTVRVMCPMHRFHRFMLITHHASATPKSGRRGLEKRHKAFPRRRQRPVSVPYQSDLALGAEVGERDVNDFRVVAMARHRDDRDPESRGDEAFHRGNLSRLEDDVGVDVVLSPQFIGSCRKPAWPERDDGLPRRRTAARARPPAGVRAEQPGTAAPRTAGARRGPAPWAAAT